MSQRVIDGPARKMSATESSCTEPNKPPGPTGSVPFLRQRIAAPNAPARITPPAPSAPSFESPFGEAPSAPAFESPFGPVQEQSDPIVAAYEQARLNALGSHPAIGPECEDAHAAALRVVRVTDPEFNPELLG